jgi:hypothetical protein
MSFAPVSMKQGDSIAAYRIVRHTATPHTVALCTATTDVIFGVTVDEALKSNQAVQVQVAGLAKVYCNDTLAAGALVMSDASGRAVPAVANTAGVYVLGVCLNTVSATGTIADVLLNPFQLQAQ